MLANFTEHTRTLRLYPRPVVAFQTNSFLRARPKTSNFMSRLAQTQVLEVHTPPLFQAVEFYAEWTLLPSNLAYQRIHTGVSDPTVIGDKFKWYAHNLEPVSFVVWDNLSSLNTALKCLRETEVVATDESGSDSDGGSSTSSFSSLGAGELREEPKVVTSSGLDPSSVYRPPESLQVRAALINTIIIKASTLRP